MAVYTGFDTKDLHGLAPGGVRGEPRQRAAGHGPQRLPGRRRRPSHLFNFGYPSHRAAPAASGDFNDFDDYHLRMVAELRDPAVLERRNRCYYLPAAAGPDHRPQLPRKLALAGRGAGPEHALRIRVDDDVEAGLAEGRIARCELRLCLEDCEGSEDRLQLTVNGTRLDPAPDRVVEKPPRPALEGLRRAVPASGDQHRARHPRRQPDALAVAAPGELRDPAAGPRLIPEGDEGWTIRTSWGSSSAASSTRRWTRSSRRSPTGPRSAPSSPTPRALSLEAGRTVFWRFGDLEIDVHVEEVVPGERIVCNWPACKRRRPPDAVRIRLRAAGRGHEGPRKRVRLAVRPARGSPAAFEQCSGWTHFFASLKARPGARRRPEGLLLRPRLRAGQSSVRMA